MTPTRWTVEPGERLVLEVVLIGRASPHVADVVRAMGRAVAQVVDREQGRLERMREGGMASREFDEAMMRLALEHAVQARDRGNTPVAAVVAKDGEVLAVGQNEARTTGDCTAHAEIVALRAASATFGADRVHGATCYTTMEPCPMCAWALIEGRITRIVMGARHRQLGRKAYGAYALEGLFDMTGRDVEIVTGVLADACGAMRLAWMREAGRES